MIVVVVVVMDEVDKVSGGGVGTRQYVISHASESRLSPILPASTRRGLPYPNTFPTTPIVSSDYLISDSDQVDRTRNIFSQPRIFYLHFLNHATAKPK